MRISDEISEWLKANGATMVQFYRHGPWNAEVLYLRDGAYWTDAAILPQDGPAIQEVVDAALLEKLKGAVGYRWGVRHTTQKFRSACLWCEGTVCDCYDRLSCEKAGEPLHYGCGWCAEHRGPRWRCEHGSRSPDEAKSISVDFLLDELQRCYDLCIPEGARGTDSHNIRHAEFGGFVGGFVADTVHATITGIANDRLRQLAELHHRLDDAEQRAATLQRRMEPSEGAPTERKSALANLQYAATDALGEAIVRFALAVSEGDHTAILTGALALRAGVAAAKEGGV